jgi:glycine/serine hydroxymethyltransferase
MREAEMRGIAGLIDAVLAAPEDEAVRRAVGSQVRELAAAFPLYAEQPAVR